jgi:hypothetical protein
MVARLLIEATRRVQVVVVLASIHLLSVEMRYAIYIVYNKRDMQRQIYLTVPSLVIVVVMH